MLSCYIALHYFKAEGAKAEGAKAEGEKAADVVLALSIVCKLVQPWTHVEHCMHYCDTLSYRGLSQL